MRKEYTMTQEDLDELLDACKPTPAMWLSGGRSMSPTPQENANNAWKALAKKMGFVWDTVNPIDGQCQLHFTAEEADEDV